MLSCLSSAQLRAAWFISWSRRQKGFHLMLKNHRHWNWFGTVSLFTAWCWGRLANVQGKDTQDHFQIYRKHFSGSKIRTRRVGNCKSVIKSNFSHKNNMYLYSLLLACCNAVFSKENIHFYFKICPNTS